MADQIYVVVKIMITPHRRRCSWHNPRDLADQLVLNWGHAGLIWLDGDGSKLGRWITLAANPIEHF